MIVLRRLAMWLVVLGGVVGLTVGAALPAAAHNVLTGSDPTDGATLKSAPTSVTLTFDQTVQNFEPVLTVTGPNGNQFQTGAPEVKDNTIATAVQGAGPAGLYTIAYRIVSADGHPVTGSVSYTLDPAAAGTATGTPAPAGTATVDSGSGLSWWLWVGIGLAALIVIAALLIILRRPAEDDSV
jgi:methionine-rich copper-binding protein CopC